MVDRFIEFVEDQPRLVRTALWGASLVVALTGLRSLVLAPTAGWQAVPAVVGAVVVGTFAGGVGGFLYGLLRRMEHLGLLGKWLRWSLGILVFSTTVVAILYPLDAGIRETVHDPTTPWVALVTTVIYGTAATWIFRDEYDDDDVSGMTADGVLSEAMASDLSELRRNGHQDPEVDRPDLIETGTPSHAYVMHLWRVVGRLGRIPAPPRQARLALRRARRLLKRTRREVARQQRSERSP
jgi:hypothetical protein